MVIAIGYIVVSPKYHTDINWFSWFNNLTADTNNCLLTFIFLTYFFRQTAYFENCPASSSATPGGNFALDQRIWVWREGKPYFSALPPANAFSQRDSRGFTCGRQSHQTYLVGGVTELTEEHYQRVPICTHSLLSSFGTSSSTLHHPISLASCFCSAKVPNKVTLHKIDFNWMVAKQTFESSLQYWSKTRPTILTYIV